MVPWGDEDDAPSFAYSIGLQETYDHPELLTYGLRPQVMHAMINGCADAIRDGRRIRDGDTWDGVLDGTTCGFRRVDEEHLGELGYARQYYGAGEYSALQLVWPDKEDRPPWEGVMRQQSLRFSGEPDPSADPKPERKRGFFGRLFGRGKD